MENIFKSLPDVLKFGVLGLVAVFGVLLFYLFKQSSSRERFFYVLLPFAVVTLLLVAVASYAGYVSKNQDNDKKVDSLQQELNIYQGSSAANETLQKKYRQILSNRDSLNLEINHVQHLMKDKETLFNNSVMLLIVEAFEDVSSETSGKSHHGMSEEDLDLARFKNAIFQRIYDFGADTSVLRATLIKLKKRGYDIDVNRLVKITPKLIRLKRAWIKDALLAYQNAAQHMSPQDQHGVSVDMKLPDEVTIIPGQPYTVVVSDDTYTRLEFEKELLEKVDF